MLQIVQTILAHWPQQVDANLPLFFALCSAAPYRIGVLWTCVVSTLSQTTAQKPVSDAVRL